MAALALRFGAPLRSYFERRLGRGADAEDLVQEVFVRLVRHADLDSVRNVDGYVFETAANLLRDRARRLAARCAGDHVEFEDQIDPAGFSPERILIGKDAIERLAAALHELPEKTRNIFALYHFEAMPHAEIKRRLGYSLSAIEKHLRRANRHILRRVRPS